MYSRKCILYVSNKSFCKTYGIEVYWSNVCIWSINQVPHIYVRLLKGKICYLDPTCFLIRRNGGDEWSTHSATRLLKKTKCTHILPLCIAEKLWQAPTIRLIHFFFNLHLLLITDNIHSLGNTHNIYKMIYKAYSINRKQSFNVCLFILMAR